MTKLSTCEKCHQYYQDNGTPICADCLKAYDVDTCKCGATCYIKKDPRMDMLSKVLNARFVIMECDKCNPITHEKHKVGNNQEQQRRPASQDKPKQDGR